MLKNNFSSIRDTLETETDVQSSGSTDGTKKGIVETMSSCDETNNGLIYCVRLGEGTIEMKAFAMIYHSMFSEEFFDEIRTKQNFGYVVGLKYTSFYNEGTFLYFQVQSERDFSKIENAIENFIQNSLAKIQKMNEKEFEQIQKRLICINKDDPKTPFCALNSLLDIFGGGGKEPLNEKSFKVVTNLIKEIENVELNVFKKHIKNLLDNENVLISRCAKKSGRALSQRSETLLNSENLVD